MSASVLIEAVEAEGFGGGGVVTPALGDVQVASVFDGRDDGGADGSQVDGPAAGAAGCGVLAEGHVPDVMMCLDRPVLADQAGQVGRRGVHAGQAGNGIDGLAGDFPGGGVLPPAGDLDGLAGAGEVQAADVRGLEGAGLGAAVPGVAGDAAVCRARTRTLPLSWCFWARYAALEYSLIKPWRTCLRLIRAVTSIVWPGSCSGGLCSRD